MRSKLFPGIRIQSSSVYQRGMSLIVVLMLLVIVSLLGVASMHIVMMGERAARSDRDMQLAWQGAEAALIDAEIELQGPNSFVNSRTTLIQSEIPAVSTGCNASAGNPWRGFCSLNSGEVGANGVPRPTWLTVDFMDSSADAPSIALGTYTGRLFQSADDATGRGIQPALSPRYVIEYIPIDLSNPSGGQTTAHQQSPFIRDSSGLRLYRVTSMGFGPRSDIQAVLQTIYRN